ncbi:hypothetical protein [Desulfonatronum thioautotrophicum]|uniref:hypothetical protein n=1 Tax=Desulfonatronum thioautotrophicum TaxID=617001 RepID=UPI001ABF1F18|nr:hypothetical protein [Desulfonatronum thioautotrophicum]
MVQITGPVRGPGRRIRLCGPAGMSPLPCSAGLGRPLVLDEPGPVSGLAIPVIAYMPHKLGPLAEHGQQTDKQGQA